MTTLRINITKEVLEATKDCDKDDPSLNQNCAIAYAVREIWPEAETYYVSIYPFSINDNRRIKHKQDKFIETFDCATPAERARMRPFSFEIEVPDEVIGEVNIEEIRRIIKNSKTLELV